MTGETVDRWLDQLTSSDWGKAALRDFRRTDSRWRFSSFSSFFPVWTPFAKAIAAFRDVNFARLQKGPSIHLHD